MSHKKYQVVDLMYKSKLNEITLRIQVKKFSAAIN